MEIRRAEISDLKKIQELNLELCKKEEKEYCYGINLNWTFSEEGEKYFKEKIVGADSATFVAIEKNRIIGYISGGIAKSESYRKIPKMSEIETMFVLKEFRSLGIGKKLYENFKEWAKENNTQIIKVQVTAQNKKGIEFYKEMGLDDYTLILEGRI